MNPTLRDLPWSLEEAVAERMTECGHTSGTETNATEPTLHMERASARSEWRNMMCRQTIGSANPLHSAISLPVEIINFLSSSL